MATTELGPKLSASLLAEIVLAIAVKLDGRAKSVLLAEINGISEQLARKQNGIPRRPLRRARAEDHGAQWLATRLKAEGVPAEEAAVMIAACPSGSLEAMLYWIFAGDSLHESTLATVRELEAIDARISSLALARDPEAMLAWLRDEARARPRLFSAVDAAGCPAAPSAGMDRDVELQARLHPLLVNMVLSFLAVLDLETRPRVATEQWDGRSLLSTLLAPATEGQRPSVRSPIALFVDLVLTIGWASMKGSLPEKRPTPLSISRLLAAKGRSSPSLDRDINSLRREHSKLDRGAMRRLVRQVKLKSAGPNQTVDDEVAMLIPMLVSAHLLSELMPRRPGRPHHDRRGWREAYLGWWRFHAVAQAKPVEPTGEPKPPDWLTFA